MGGFQLHACGGRADVHEGLFEDAPGGHCCAPWRILNTCIFGQPQLDRRSGEFQGGEKGGGGERQGVGLPGAQTVVVSLEEHGEEERGSLFTSHGDTALMWVDEHGDEDPGRIRPLSGSVQLRPTGWMDSQIAVTQDLSGESFRTRIARKLQPFEALREWESRLVKHELTPHRDPRSQPRPMVSGLLSRVCRQSSPCHQTPSFPGASRP